MAYIGIGYSGNDKTFLYTQVEKHSKWLKGDRPPHFFGDCFLVLYDSNTAREFAHKCELCSGANEISVYQMGRPIEK
ncbi:MAG TPA: hypothetical protein DCO75_00230 [Fibrobacteres bacterium]|jgi:hypothetical protein|nr:hypothetical protein [Fibrobacterota bacterium]